MIPGTNIPVLLPPPHMQKSCTSKKRERNDSGDALVPCQESTGEFPEVEKNQLAERFPPDDRMDVRTIQTNNRSLSPEPELIILDWCLYHSFFFSFRSVLFVWIIFSLLFNLNKSRVVNRINLFDLRRNIHLTKMSRHRQTHTLTLATSLLKKIEIKILKIRKHHSTPRHRYTFGQPFKNTEGFLLRP